MYLFMYRSMYVYVCRRDQGRRIVGAQSYGFPYGLWVDHDRLTPSPSSQLSL